jgi:hypothetical protein
VTEAQWLACTDPMPMLEFLRGKASNRKLRLFAVECFRRVLRFRAEERHRLAVQVKERYVEGQATQQEVGTAIDGEYDDPYYAVDPFVGDAWLGADYAAYCSANLAASAPDDEQNQAGARFCPKEQAAQCDLLREIFGNPFRPVTLDPAGQTSTVVALAHAAYYYSAT